MTATNEPFEVGAYRPIALREIFEETLTGEDQGAGALFAKLAAVCDLTSNGVRDWMYGKPPATPKLSQLRPVLSFFSERLGVSQAVLFKRLFPL